MFLGGFPDGSAGKESVCNVGDLGWEDPLEKGMATHSSILAWRIPWTYSPWGSQRVRHNQATFTFTYVSNHIMLEHTQKETAAK